MSSRRLFHGAVLLPYSRYGDEELVEFVLQTRTPYSERGSWRHIRYTWCCRTHRSTQPYTTRLGGHLDMHAAPLGPRRLVGPRGPRGVGFLDSFPPPGPTSVHSSPSSLLDLWVSGLWSLVSGSLLRCKVLHHRAYSTETGLPSPMTSSEWDWGCVACRRFTKLEAYHLVMRKTEPQCRLNQQSHSRDRASGSRGRSETVRRAFPPARDSTPCAPACRLTARPPGGRDIYVREHSIRTCCVPHGHIQTVAQQRGSEYGALRTWEQDLDVSTARGIAIWRPGVLNRPCAQARCMACICPSA